MSRQVVNRASAVAPIVMSLLAWGLVIFAATTGWQTRQPDEGAAARLFQLLIFTQPMLVLIFLATSEWRRPMRVVGVVALHMLGAALALGTLLYFESNGF